MGNRSSRTTTPDYKKLTSPAPQRDLLPDDPDPMRYDEIREEDPTIWGLLTPFYNIELVSKRYQRKIYLRLTEQCIGLILKENPHFLNKTEVSNNYGIYITRIGNEDEIHTSSYYPTVFLRDTSTFNTYLNGKKLTKEKPVQVHNGDIISLGAFRFKDGAMKFRYEEITRSSPWQEGPIATYDDQLKGLRDELVGIKELLCVKEQAKLKDELMTELMAKLNLQPFNQ